MTSLLDEYKEYMPYYRRFIDDGIGIWLMHKPNAQAKFDEFFKRLNDWGDLKWTCTGFTDSLQFMDLTVSITADNHIHFKTFQKELNLYLYIPPCSAHSKSMIRGLIFGRLRAYYIHNTDTDDYHNMAMLLAFRLINRGWEWNFIKQIFDAAHDRITNNIKKAKKNLNMTPIFIHTTYHPRGIQRDEFRKIWNSTLGLDIPNPLIVAVHRPKNLRDKLCNSKLPLVKNNNPSDLIK